MKRNDTKYTANRFIYLFGSLILLIILMPTLQQSSLGKSILNTSFLVTSLLSITTMRHQHLKFSIAALLGAMAISINFLDLIFPNQTMDSIRVMITSLFFSCISISLFSSILREREVTNELIMAALCTYVFIGFSFAEVYQAIDMFSPHSFSGVTAMTNQFKIITLEYLYFSFTTLTTVGFGDIVPISLQAKAIVIIEEVTGLFYMAIFVSRLIAAERRAVAQR